MNDQPKRRGRPPKTTITTTAEAPQIVWADTPPPEPVAVVQSQSPVVVAPHPQYDYKFLYPTVAATTGTRWEAAFDALGKEGYEFVGESAGKSVFRKSIS